MSAEGRVARNAAWLVLQPLAMNLLSLAATGYIARQLGAVEFGRFNLAYAFVALFAPLANLGIRSLTVRHVARHREEARPYLGRVLVLRGLLALVAAGVVTLATPLSGGGGDVRVVIGIAACGMIVTTIATLFVDAFQAFECVRPAAKAQFVGGGILTLASVTVIAAGGGIREMALAYVLGPLCTLALLLYWARREPFWPRLCWDPKAFGRLLREASPFFLMTLLEVVSTRIDLLVIARLLDEASLGCYTAAMGLASRSLILAEGAGSALLPAVAHLAATEPATAVRLLRRSALWLLLISLPSALVIATLSPLIIKLLFGSQYVTSAPILTVAIWQLPAMCLAILAGHSLVAVQRQGLVLRTGAVSTFVSLALLVPLTHGYGPAGAAAALIVRPLLAFLLRLPAMARAFPGVWAWSELARLLLALLVMAVPLALVPSIGMGLAAVGLAMVSGCVYLAVLAVTRLVPLGSLARRLVSGVAR